MRSENPITLQGTHIEFAGPASPDVAGSRKCRMYYDPSTNELLVSKNAEGYGSVLTDLLTSVQVAAGTPHTDSTDEAVLGSYLVPASTIGVGTVVRISYQGIATSTNGTDTLTIRLRIGATTLTGTALITTGAINATNDDIFTGYFELVGREAAGAESAVVGFGHYSDPGAAGTALKNAFIASTDLATNGILLIEVTADWSVAHADNICRLDILNVEIR